MDEDIVSASRERLEQRRTVVRQTGRGYGLRPYRRFCVTLPSHQVADNGLCVIREMPGVRSSIRIETSDLDCVSSYPHTQICLNISRETTFRELSKVRGLEDLEWRKFGLNLSGGHSNAMELGAIGWKYPSPDKLLKAFKVAIEK